MKYFIDHSLRGGGLSTNPIELGSQPEIGDCLLTYSNEYKDAGAQLIIVKIEDDVLHVKGYSAKHVCID